MRETQESICQWAEETFGVADSLFRIATRAHEEMSELLVCVELNPEDQCEEAADIAIILCRLGKRLGVNTLEMNSFLSQALEESSPSSTRLEAAEAGFHLVRLVRGIERGDPELELLSALELCIGHLRRLCRCRLGNLQEEIDRKMAVNRTREWALDDHGHGYHCGA